MRFVASTDSSHFVSVCKVKAERVGTTFRVSICHSVYLSVRHAHTRGMDRLNAIKGDV